MTTAAPMGSGGEQRRTAVAVKSCLCHGVVLDRHAVHGLQPDHLLLDRSRRGQVVYADQRFVERVQPPSNRVPSLPTHLCGWGCQLSVSALSRIQGLPLATRGRTPLTPDRIWSFWAWPCLCVCVCVRVCMLRVCKVRWYHRAWDMELTDMPDESAANGFRNLGNALSGGGRHSK